MPRAAGRPVIDAARAGPPTRSPTAAARQKLDTASMPGIERTRTGSPPARAQRTQDLEAVGTGRHCRGPPHRCATEAANDRRSAMRGDRRVRTTAQDSKTAGPPDCASREFSAGPPTSHGQATSPTPRSGRSTSTPPSRRIVGRLASRSMTTDFMLDAQEQAPHARQPERGGSLAHHPDRGSL